MDKLVFQTDHPAVRREFAKDNYKIVYEESQPKEYCALYFSSHSIYFPNEEAIFYDRIIRKDSYEWFKTRVNFAYKHIFMRDIFKQWYLSGINSSINSPDKLLDFLKEQSHGYKIIALGASAGGYAAVLYGSLLGADRILSFNGQMELKSILRQSSEEVDPLIFRLKNSNVFKYYDLKSFINKDSPVYYFCSMRSEWDIEQAKHVANAPINVIKFNVAKHGIPFLKCSLPDVINYTTEQLHSLKESIHNPLMFSVSISGYARVGSYCLKEMRRLISILFLYVIGGRY